MRRQQKIIPCQAMLLVCLFFFLFWFDVVACCFFLALISYVPHNILFFFSVGVVFSLLSVFSQPDCICRDPFFFSSFQCCHYFLAALSLCSLLIAWNLIAICCYSPWTGYSSSFSYTLVMEWSYFNVVYFFIFALIFILSFCHSFVTVCHSSMPILFFEFYL